MAIANEQAVKYQELTDEHIKDIKVGIEKFVQSNEYWDRFAHHSTVPRGKKIYTSRRLIAPKVNKEDVKPRAELVAPRPSKITVATFEKTVDNYGDKAIYSREDLQYHFDDTVANIRTTLQEIAIQKLNIVKGKAFFQSRATVTAVNDGNSQPSILLTSEQVAIIFRKNKVKRWDGKLFLAHITPEELKQLRAEIEAKGARLSEPVKKELDGRTYDGYEYCDFFYSVTADDLMYKNDTTQYIVYMGRRAIDGQSPVDVSKLKGESGIEVINNGLGSGVLIDEDGNYTSDDNKQQGSVAINMDGLGACVSDDLCLLDCEFTIDVIKASALPLSDMTGYVSHSGNEVEVGLTGTTYTELSVNGARHDATAGKYFASGSTIIEVVVAAAATKTLGSVTKANWSGYYYLDKSDKDADTDASATTNQKPVEFIAFIDSNKKALVRVPANAYEFKIDCAATAS